jgi:type I restriction enzyme S subunit
MDVKPGYKQTEVGVIPEDWNVVNFGDLVNYTKGYAFKSSEYVDNGVRVIRVSDTTYDSIKDDGAVFVAERSANRYTTWCLRENELIFSTVGSKPPMYDSLVGKVILVPHEYSGSLLNQNAVLIRAKKYSQSFQKLLLNHFRTDRYIQYIETIFRGNANQASITLADLFKYKLPIPPTKAEQEAIAEALSDSDALIESLEQLLAKKRQIKQGAMQELLTGKKRLPEFSGEWGTSPLRRFVRQFIVPMRDKPKRLTGDIPWCRIEDFDGMYLTGSKSGQFVDIETVRAMNLKVYPAGTLLVSCSADLGRCAIVARPLVSNQTFIGLEIDESVASNVFFYYFMTSRAEELNNLSSGTTISYLSREQFEEFVAFVPIGKKEQTAIATVLSDMDAEIAALEAKLAKARQIKQGMMQELLTGRIRLV